jgi:hypothetical protein
MNGGIVGFNLDGFNVCIFAYGQTGSGKTFTMEGDSNGGADGRGVAPRAIHELFRIGNGGAVKDVNEEGGGSVQPTPCREDRQKTPPQGARGCRFKETMVPGLATNLCREDPLVSPPTPWTISA